MITKEEAVKYLGKFSIPPMTSNLPEAVAEHQNYIDTLRLAQQSLQNEINFIEELEKVKTETLKLFCDTCNSAQSCYKTDSACHHQCVFEEALEDMINNHISKLKGENGNGN